MAGAFVGTHLVRGARPPEEIKDLNFDLVEGYALPKMERREARPDLPVWNTRERPLAVSIDARPAACDATAPPAVFEIQVLSAGGAIFGAPCDKPGTWFIAAPAEFEPHLQKLVRDDTEWRHIEAADSDRRALIKKTIAAAIAAGRVDRVTGLPTGEECDARSFPHPHLMVAQRGHEIRGVLRSVKRVDAVLDEAVIWADQAADPRKRSDFLRQKSDDRQAALIASAVAQALAAHASQQQAGAPQKAAKP